MRVLPQAWMTKSCFGFDPRFPTREDGYEKGARSRRRKRLNLGGPLFLGRTPSTYGIGSS